VKGLAAAIVCLTLLIAAAPASSAQSGQITRTFVIEATSFGPAKLRVKVPHLAQTTMCAYVDGRTMLRGDEMNGGRTVTYYDYGTVVRANFKDDYAWLAIATVNRDEQVQVSFVFGYPNC
jgi:hypothetical protein